MWNACWYCGAKHCRLTWHVCGSSAVCLATQSVFQSSLAYVTNSFLFGSTISSEFGSFFIRRDFYSFRPTERTIVLHCIRLSLTLALWILTRSLSAHSKMLLFLWRVSLNTIRFRGMRIFADGIKFWHPPLFLSSTLRFPSLVLTGWNPLASSSFSNHCHHSQFRTFYGDEC